jgi:hypothetical protein
MWRAVGNDDWKWKIDMGSKTIHFLKSNKALYIATKLWTIINIDISSKPNSEPNKSNVEKMNDLFIISVMKINNNNGLGCIFGLLAYRFNFEYLSFF